MYVLMRLASSLDNVLATQVEGFPQHPIFLVKLTVPEKNEVRIFEQQALNQKNLFRWKFVLLLIITPKMF